MRERDKSALVVLIPEAEDLVGAFRRQFDISAISGLPPHVTILCPFISPDAISAKVLADLHALFEGYPRFDFSLVGVCGFPSVVYLAPDPLAPFDSLTNATSTRYPEFPPYGGAFSKPVPHLTVAQSPPADNLGEVSGGILSRMGDELPFRCCARDVALAVKIAGRWSIEERFPLA